MARTLEVQGTTWTRGTDARGRETWTGAYGTRTYVLTYGRDGWTVATGGEYVADGCHMSDAARQAKWHARRKET